MSNQKPGSWLIRYSLNEKQIIISRKNASGKIEHLKFQDIDPKKSNLQDIKKTYGEDLLVRTAPSPDHLKPPSPATLMTHSDLKFEPAYQGALRQSESEALLQDKPAGSWLIRYSERENQTVLSIKNVNDTIIHLKELKIGEDNINIALLPLKDIINFFGEGRLLKPPIQPGSPLFLDVTKDPAFFKNLSPEDAAKTLMNHPPGSWLICKQQNNVMLVMKNKDGEIENFTALSLNGISRYIKDISSDELRSAFGTTNLVFSKGFSLPPTPFSPVHMIMFKNQKERALFMQSWLELGSDMKNHIVAAEIPKLVPGEGVDTHPACIVSFGEEELLASGKFSDAMNRAFGKRGVKSVFAGIYDYKNRVVKVAPLQTLEDLTMNSKNYFKYLKPIDFELQIPFAEMNPPMIIHNILTEQNFNGFIIGEIHSEKNSKKFLIDNMQQLKNEGVETLFLEFLPFDTLQHDIDAYLSGPPGVFMPRSLELLLDEKDTGFEIGKNSPYGFKALVRAAKNAGIRVVGIETNASEKAGFTDMGSTGSERTMGLNFTAQEIIKREKGQSKFVALMGNTHATTSYGVPGLSEILDVQISKFLIIKIPLTHN